MAGAELLPKLIQNASYLEQNDMVLVNGPEGDPHGLTIKWRAVARHPFPYAISQMPSDHNALGSFLLDMGILQRAGRLGEGADAAVRERLQGEVERLAGPDAMGSLFKVLAIAPRGIGLPGFTASN